MILGVGVDLVEVGRMRALYARYGRRLLERIYLPEEIAYLVTLEDPAPALAARFAAKEAFVKAYPGKAWITEVGVARDPRPRLVFRGRLAEEVARRGIRPWVSLSHERGHAVAVVVLELTSPPQAPRSSESSP